MPVIDIHTQTHVRQHLHKTTLICSVDLKGVGVWDWLVAVVDDREHLCQVLINTNEHTHRNQCRAVLKILDRALLKPSLRIILLQCLPSP